MKRYLDHGKLSKSTRFGVLAAAAVAFAALAPTADGETVHFGNLSELTGPDDLDLTGSIVYAIDVGGPGRTLSGIAFNQDNNPYSPATTGMNNEAGPGSWESTFTTGYYPSINSPGNWNTSFSGDPDLDAIMSHGRNDSGVRRVSQLDVVAGKTYKIQILAKHAWTPAEDRRFDLSVGFGTDDDHASGGAVDTWNIANLAVDNLEEGTPRLWSHTLVASGEQLWINASNANGYGDLIPGGIDPNPIINAIIVSEILPLAPHLAIETINGGSDLRFTWETEDGKVYDILSDTGLGADPGTWTPFVTNLDSSPYEMPLPADPARFFAITKKDAPPVILYSENFDSTAAGLLPDDWASGTNPADNSSLTNWELGTPANLGPIPPGVPLPSGANCVATNISGNYDDPATDLGIPHTDIWLRTSAINLGDATEGALTFQQWTEIEDVAGDLDYGSIRILDASDESELAVIEDQSIDGNTSGWEEHSVALPPEVFNAMADTIIKVEFRFEADDIDSFAGWYIDDVTVTTP